ncbi:ATP-binding protein [Metamycoplasma salivarium]|uniref:ATPase, AAA+ superfamily n=2 Tax=Metamycoplasma salivarium TaxID=2124 RepID=A0A448ZYU1_METSV|nr:DUF4143 domain-containing protein [Metamycoplasma salivarium]CAD7361224.1 Uncharacterised protein [Metamycoplasma salivarium]VEU56420.1 Uncharacterised protein [Metamycoplasma salivarium]
MYKRRLVDEKIEEALKTNAALIIEGPKWCGKTYTGIQNTKSQMFLDNLIMTKYDKEKVIEMCLDGEKPRLIDEWQILPILWDLVRRQVDFNKGKYILTGSERELNTYHSGIGRYIPIQMFPMSLYELEKSTGQVSLMDLFNKRYVFERLNGKKFDLNDIANLIVKGGWPSQLENDDIRIASMYCAMLEKHEFTKFVIKKNNLSRFMRFIMSLSRNECTLVANETIIKDIENDKNFKISRPTLNSYFKILEDIFIVDNIKPYITNIRSSRRLSLSVKKRFVDPSLACGFLKINAEKLKDDLNFLGILFESMVLRDLRIYSYTNDWNLYYFRDSKGNEIDAILEKSDGSWAAVEIKLSDFSNDDASKNLLKVAKMITNENDKEPSFLLIINGLTGEAYKRPDGVYVAPISMLKN